MPLPVYLDYAATTPVDPRVAQRMSECLLTTGNFGNPASRSHLYGWRAEEAVEEARAQVAALLQADPREIVFTAGATEAINLALKGAAEYYGSPSPQRQARRHLITSAIEHKAVLDTCAYLESRGFALTYLQPDGNGLISPAQVAAALRPDTLLVSVMHVNNELGVINDIAGIGACCRERGVLLHVDAAQSAGKLALDMQHMAVDLLSLSAHKMYGPKGAGALYVRRQPQVRLTPQMHGGGHERGLRSGTLATHQIVGLGEAARLMQQEMQHESARIAALRDLLWQELQVLDGITLNGAGAPRVCGIANISFAGVDGETLLLALDDLALSTGSACTSETVEPSYVLRALGVPDALAHASLRFSLGRFSTRQEVLHAASRVVAVVSRLRAANPAQARPA